MGLKRKPVNLDAVSIRPRWKNDDDTFYENIELAQTLLNETRSIDQTAELMSEEPNNVWYWRNNIIRAVTLGKLII